MDDEISVPVKGKDQIIESLQASCGRLHSKVFEHKKTIAAQSEHISKLGKQIAEQEAKWEEDTNELDDQRMKEWTRAETAEAELQGICDILPSSYYADRLPAERVAFIVRHWQKLVPICEALQAELDKLRESKDICPVCMTWSWAPCDEGDEGAEQRGEEWALCQCCNDSRIAVLWKGRAEELQEKCDAAFTGLLGASRGECIDWGRKDRQPEIDKLREAGQAVVDAKDAIRLDSGLAYSESMAVEWVAIEALKAALGEGDEKC